MRIHIYRMVPWGIRVKIEGYTICIHSNSLSTSHSSQSGSRSWVPGASGALFVGAQVRVLLEGLVYVQSRGSLATSRNGGLG